MIDVKGYIKKKEKSLVKLVKAGNNYAVVSQKFDPDSGDRLPDEVIGVNMEELLNKRQALADELVDIDSFISDCKALGEEEN